jgi:hypothetical protein
MMLSALIDKVRALFGFSRPSAPLDDLVLKIDLPPIVPLKLEPHEERWVTIVYPKEPPTEYDKAWS